MKLNSRKERTAFPIARAAMTLSLTVVGLTLGLVATAAHAQETATKKPATAEKVENVQIPKGSVVVVLLDTEISSKTAKAGDAIEATLSSSDGADIFPKKTVFKGKITQLNAKTASGPAVATAAFTQAILPDGTKVEIDATPRPLKSAAETKDASTQKKRRGGGIGGKAAGGALIGTAVAGNDAVGAIVGGTVAAAAAGGKQNKEAAAEAAKTVDIVIKEGTKFELVFNKSFIIKKAVPK